MNNKQIQQRARDIFERNHSSQEWLQGNIEFCRREVNRQSSKKAKKHWQCWLDAYRALKAE